MDHGTCPWVEDGIHLVRMRNGRKEWMAHCSKCGMGVKEMRNRPSDDYLCDECWESEQDDEDQS